MGDMGDIFNDWRAYKKEVKAQYATGAGDAMNRLFARPDIVKHVEARGGGGENGGCLRINDAYDWWPCTGTWMKLRSKTRGRGISSLLKQIEKET